MRKLLLLFIAVFALLGSGLGVGVWWLGTERGTAWLLSVIEARALPYLTIGRAQVGLEHLTLEDVQLRLGSHEITIDTAMLAWQPTQLLRGMLMIDELALGETRYRRIESAAIDTDTTGGGFSAPLRIVIRRGSLQALSVELGPTPLVFGPTALISDIAGSVVALEQVTSVTSVTGDEIRLSGDARFDFGARTSMAVRLEWEGAVQGRQGRGRAAIAGVWPELDVRHELDAPFGAVLEGALQFEEALRADLTVTWSEVPLDQAGRLRSPGGELTLTGTLENYSFQGTAGIAFDDERIAVAAAGQGSQALLSVEALTVEHAAGALAASGEIALDAREWRLAVRAERLDPAWLAPDWPGRLTGLGEFEGGLLPDLRLTLDGLRLQGDLLGRRVGATGRVDYREGQWDLAAVRLESDELAVLLDGQVGPGSLALRFSASSSNLGSLWPDARGALTAQGEVSGIPQAPAITATLAGEGIAVGPVTVAALTFEGQGGIAPDAPVVLTLAADGVAIGTQQAERIRVDVAGTAGAHSLQLRATLPGQSAVAAQAAGGLGESRRWRGRLEALTVEQPAVGAWQLLAPAALELGTDWLALGETCLQQGDARICAQLARTGAPSDSVVLTADEVDLGLIAPFVSEQVSLAGRYSAELSITDLSGVPSGLLTLNGGATELGVIRAGEPPLGIGLASVSLSASLEQWQLGLAGAVVGSGSEPGNAAFTVRFDDVRGPDAGVDAVVRVHWPDLAFLGLLSPDVGEIDGVLDLAMTVAGRVSEPEFSGEASLQRGRMVVPRWGFVVDSIEARGMSADGRRLEFEVVGQVDDARLQASGETVLDHRAGWPTRMQLTGDRLRAVQLPEAEIFIIPDLLVQAALPDVSVTGSVQVPRARITLTSLPDQAVVPSEDAVVHGIERPPAPRPLQVRAELDLALGQDVRYLGSGLDVGVTGQMALNYASGQTATGSGNLTLNGQYVAYGQTLMLERGQLVFAGPLNDPVLDVRAVREIEAQTIGVQLSGTLSAPQVRIFSEPALSEADALAYLVLGRPLSGTGESENAALESAAVSLGLQQALPMVQRVGQSLGLDELTVQSTATDAGALMLGKYLSPRVYIRYSYGFFNRVGGVLLRLRVNERFSVETRSGDENSMDFLYTVERD